ncbi:MAG TPA: glycosyltransferase family 39 protein [Ignavibacteria bacterium]|nr:glycosyltransferase family 39 protein [Ignavibacteria bacterium]
MSDQFFKLENYLNNGKNFYKIFFFLVVFLCAVKLPSILTSDIQPWDEGMYATRVLSVHTNGDIIEQSRHSVGGFYSASHPPLLIWIGYLVTLITGVNSVSLKLIIFVFSLLCVLLIMLIGRNLFTASVGFYASLVFCGNIIFAVFSQRFQFDYPYTFFILLSFYFIFKFNDRKEYRYLIFSGISFGMCLMVKILVGFYIPLVLFISYFLIKDKVSYGFKDLMILTSIGIVIALPWHLYMILNFGNSFIDYFLKFHIYQRIVEGVEFNEKSSGVLYHINYLFSIIPYSILMFPGIIYDLKNYKDLDWKKIFLLVWFISGLVIITLLKTKLEVYVLMILVPGCFLIPLYIRQISGKNIFHNTILLFFTFLNIFWYLSESYRPQIKDFIFRENILIDGLMVVSFLLVLLYTGRYLANKIELKKSYYIFILVFFFTVNIYYLFFVPHWVNIFKLSEISNYIKENPLEDVVYIGSNYRHNPQFSFYFKGLNLNWENPEYNYVMFDTKKDNDILSSLDGMTGRDYYLILEKDYINRAVYPPSDSIVPGNMKLILKNGGYELYGK